MICRVLVWSGGSWLTSITLCSSTCSRVMSAANRMITPFSLAEKSLLFFDTAAMSACSLDGPEAGAVNPARASGACSTQCTGAVLRSSRNSCSGMRSSHRPGSVGSKPAGRTGAHGSTGVLLHISVTRSSGDRYILSVCTGLRRISRDPAADPSRRASVAGRKPERVLLWTSDPDPLRPQEESMGNPVIVEAVRTPQGKRRGWLAGRPPGRASRRRPDRGAQTLRDRPRPGRAGHRRLRHPGG